MSGSIDLHRTGGVAEIVLNRPDKHNAMTPAMAAALRDACREADEDGFVAAVVLSGAGDKAFLGRHRHHRHRGVRRRQRVPRRRELRGAGAGAQEAGDRRPQGLGAGRRPRDGHGVRHPRGLAHGPLRGAGGDARMDRGGRHVAVPPRPDRLRPSHEAPGHGRSHRRRGGAADRPGRGAGRAGAGARARPCARGAHRRATRRSPAGRSRRRCARRSTAASGRACGWSAR